MYLMQNNQLGALARFLINNSGGLITRNNVTTVLWGLVGIFVFITFLVLFTGGEEVVLEIDETYYSDDDGAI